MAQRRKPNKWRVGQVVGDMTLVERVTFTDGDSRKSKWLGRCPEGHEKYLTSSSLLKLDKLRCNTCRLHPHLVSCGRQRLSMDRFNEIKAGAKNKGRTFALTIAQLEKLYRSQKGKCALSGTFIYLGSRRRTNASLDRINSDGHYTLGNVQWVSKAANMARGSMTVDEFVKLCEQVTQHRSRKRGD